MKIENKDALSFLKTVDDNSVDLIYIDPPFNTGLECHKDGNSFSDIFESQEHYLDLMRSCFNEFKRVLKQSGSLLVHISPLMSCYLQVELDKIFGINNRINVLRWRRCNTINYSIKGYLKEYDDILYYAKCKGKHIFKKHPKNDLSNDVHNTNTTFNLQRHIVQASTSMPQKTVEKEKTNTLNFTEFYQKMVVGFLQKEVMEAKLKDGSLWIETNKKGEKNVFYKSQSTKSRNEIIELFADNNTEYPTQKPKALLQLLIESHSNEGDTVLDCFLGGGTTAVVAKALNRNFIGCDQNPQAIELTNRRLENEVVKLRDFKNPMSKPQATLKPTSKDQQSLFS